MKSNDLAPPVLESPTVPPVSNLQTVVEESKANLLNADAPPVKRGRGRPKGSKSQVVSESQSTGPSSASGAVSDTAPDSSGMGVQSLSTLIKLPFSLRARTTGFEEYRLDDPTAQELAVAWDKALAPFIGAVNTPWGVLAMTIASTGMVIIAKEMELADFREKTQPPKQKAKTSESETNEVPPEVNAMNPWGDDSHTHPPISASQFIHETRM